MVHLETNLYEEYPLFYTDHNVFSDRQDGLVHLSEWDAVYASTGTINKSGWRLQYERDMPLDRSGLVRRYVAVQLRFEFKWSNAASTQTSSLHK